MSESDSFEQEATDGISEQVDALKGFLDDEGLAGGSPSTSEAGEAEDQGDQGAQDPDGNPFESAVSAVESRWTSHGGDAPEHEPVAVQRPDEPVDPGFTFGRSTPDGGWERVTAPDGEEIDESGGSSDGYESGQDGGSMS